jgi:hypothetical protein
MACVRVRLFIISKEGEPKERQDKERKRKAYINKERKRNQEFDASHIFASTRTSGQPP